jgi:hypothetical protein
MIKYIANLMRRAYRRVVSIFKGGGSGEEKIQRKGGGGGEE